MSIFSKLKPLTQQRIQSHAKGMDAFGFFNLLTGPELYDTVEDLLPKHRERLFPPTETLAMFLAQAMSTDCSCQNVVNQAAIQRIHDGLPACNTATGGYCRARQKLPTDMISTLVRRCGQLMDAQVPATWRWCGRPVRLIDGTTVSMPDTPGQSSDLSATRWTTTRFRLSPLPLGRNHLPVEWCGFECGYGKISW